MKETTELRFTSGYCCSMAWVLRPSPSLSPGTAAHLGCQGCQHGHPKGASVYLSLFLKPHPFSALIYTGYSSQV
ncbi:hypothetical protein FIBSPDRAFT_863074 [Athelia psychrophila]|uniref:Uncharacterized protein n=1 Tax=Athelia psychrophila TaxID=1759441 RepID=A0A167W4W1_9AGAM|nr:hypothetical protein FIBSPDRAFT_877224 [Fibularhizoctonia sp. CBS 109695]KZP19146.1 hypothetical protein FIBSPDRAFT_863074 [Fibularhizoctonia sp. CBS 109695]